MTSQLHFALRISFIALDEARFASFRAMKLIRRANEAENSYFSIFENLESIEISNGNKFRGENMKLPHIRGFQTFSGRKFWDVAGRNFYHQIRIDLKFRWKKR